MINTCICIYSHSSYKSLTELVLESLKKLNISIPIYIFRDTENEFPTTSIISKIITYNDTLAYAQKLQSCAQQVKEKYMILYQEKDILFSYDEKKIENIIDYMSSNNVATVDLHINQALFNPPNDDIMTADEKKNYPTNYRNKQFVKDMTIAYKDITLTKALDYHYSCGPRIWNVECLLHILSHFPHKSYRQIECQEVDSFMINHHHISLKLGNGEKDIFVFAGRGFKMLDYFAWLSVTNHRKIIDDRYWGDFRVNMLNALRNINMTRDSFLNIKLE